MKQKSFPQANDLNKLLKVLELIGENNNIDYKKISEIINFEPRQSQYYLSALFYFDIVNSDNKITDIGNEILNTNELKANKLYSVILQDPIFSDIYSVYSLKLSNNKKEYAIDKIRKYFPEYSESVVSRRANTAIAWVKEINEYINKI